MFPAVALSFVLPAALAGTGQAPPGLQPVPVTDILVGEVPAALQGCDAAMGTQGVNVTRWVRCGERTVSVVGSPPWVDVDVEGLLDGVPASAGAALGAPVAGAPTAVNHADQTLPALRLTRLQDGVVRDVGLAVAWSGGLLREVGMCFDPAGGPWCEAALTALLTPPWGGGAPDLPEPGRSMTLLMEPAPAGVDAPTRLLQPVPAPRGTRLVGCQRYQGVEDPAVARLDCTQGRVVAEPVAERGRFDLDAARARLLPYLSLEGAELRPGGAPVALTLGGNTVQAAPVVGEGISGVVIQDPTSPSPRAIGCLDRAPGFGQTPWCNVALQTLWGPAAGDPPPPKPE